MSTTHVAGAPPGSFTVTPLELDGIVLVQLAVHGDSRGFFTERYHQARFQQHGLPTAFVQDNHSRSAPGVIRGLHYQHAPPQGKLVGVTRGRIWDVAVDIRPGSSTFGRSVAAELSDMNGRLLWIPAGFAHGFCVRATIRPMCSTRSTHRTRPTGRAEYAGTTSSSRSSGRSTLRWRLTATRGRSRFGSTPSIRRPGSPAVRMPEHDAFMRDALAQAGTASRNGEVPVGAVVVLDGRVIGVGFNRPIGDVDPTAHAEVVALRSAARSCGNYRLTDATLYVTIEPCLMCAGALVHARIATLVFGAREPKAGAVRSVMRALDDSSLNHQVTVVEGVLEDDCRHLLQAFFDGRRRAGER